MNLTLEALQLITVAIDDALSGCPDERLVGISCLAPGADCLFAEAILRQQGVLEVIVPAADYRTQQANLNNLERYETLIAAATRVTALPFAHSNPEAYQAANDCLLSSCERLIAIWDGQSAADAGGTGAVVEQAGLRGLPTVVIWPIGAARCKTSSDRHQQHRTNLHDVDIRR